MQGERASNRKKLSFPPLPPPTAALSPRFFFLPRISRIDTDDSGGIFSCSIGGSTLRGFSRSSPRPLRAPERALASASKAFRKTHRPPATPPPRPPSPSVLCAERKLGVPPPRQICRACPRKPPPLPIKLNKYPQEKGRPSAFLWVDPGFRKIKYRGTLQKVPRWFY